MVDEIDTRSRAKKGRPSPNQQAAAQRAARWTAEQEARWERERVARRRLHVEAGGDGAAFDQGWSTERERLITKEVEEIRTRARTTERNRIRRLW